MMAVCTGNAQASSLTLVGPSLGYDISGWADSGIQFKAIQDLTLTGFVVNNQGGADTVWLQDGNGNTLQTYYSPSGDSAHLVSGLSWSLSEGEIYRLILEGASNGKWTSYFDYPTANDHIEVQGVAQGNSLYTSYWFTFNQLTTTGGPGSSVVPEPATLLLFGAGLTGMVLRRRRV